MNEKLQNKDYIKTFVALKERILQAQYNSYSAVNSEMILAYLDIGKVISEKTKTGWGTSVIKRLSKDLQAEFPGVKGFSERNLHRMKLVYEEMQTFSISPQLVAKLHWGHTVLIFSKIKDKEQRIFYLQKAKAEAWSRSILEEKIKIDLYLQHQSFQSNFDTALSKQEVAKYTLQFKDEYDQQLNWYLHLLDKTVKYPDDNPSIGILLCKTKSEITVKYALEIVNKPIGVATYSYSELPKEIAANLPDDEEFKRIFN